MDDEPAHVTSTRAAYDATADVYVERVGTRIDPTIEGPVDRALLAAFVELVRSAPAGLVADLGCGPGRVAALLAAEGVGTVGIDLSPAMVAAARAAHPGLRFEVADLSALPFADGSIAGAVCWYSIIHTPASHLPVLFGEVARVLAAGAPVLVAFQSGDGEAVRRDEVGGRRIDLTSHQHVPEAVALVLEGAGLQVDARAVRGASLPHETGPQAFLLAHRPGAGGAR